LRVLTVLAFVALIGQLALMQFVQGASYQRSATRNRVRVVLTEGERGVIYDRDGRILARNTALFNVAVVPANLPDNPDVKVSSVQRRALYGEVIKLIQVALADYDTGRLKLPTPLPGAKYTWSATAAITTTTDGTVSTIMTGTAAIAAPRPATTLGAPYFVGKDTPPAPSILTIDEIDSRVNQRELGSAFQPVLIAENLPSEVAMRIEEERYRLPGVELMLRSTRAYPSGADTGNIIGYMGPIPEEAKTLYEEKGYSADAWVGWSGLEFTFEDALRGQPGRRVIEVDVNGRERSAIGQQTPPQSGENLILSLDLELQEAMRTALVQGIDPKRSESAVAIALDPRSGHILGMVSLPTYDNNVFADGITPEEYKSITEAKGEPLLNHAIGGIYSPGSTFKMVPASAGLQEKVINVNSLLTDPGIIYIPNRNFPNDPNLAQPFVCWIYKLGGSHGDINVREALGESCDVFFYKLGGGWYATNFEGLGVERLAEYARRFGFGELSQIDLPGESAGLIPTDKWKRLTKGERWVTGDTYNMAIGQGDVLVTPLQLAMMTATVANGGKLYRPQLVAAVTDANNRLVERKQPDLRRDVGVTEKNLAAVREGMWMAVNWSHGTARNAALPDVTVAGKTGTSEFFDPDIPRDDKGNLPTHAWFTAFAPYEAPEIVVTVFVYNGGEGSSVAVPIARSILRTYFDLKNRDAADGSHSLIDQFETPAP
jgi:penicillin-binding protein 2